MERNSMNKLIFLGLLSFTQVNFLMADEYISDAYFEEVAAQSNFSYEALESLPITQTVEEEARLNAEIDNVIIEEPMSDNPLVEEAFIENNHALDEGTQTIQALSYETILEQAKREGKTIMLTIRSTNCKYCDKMEAGTLSDESVKEALRANFLTLHYNQDLETLPLNLQNGATPMFIFVNTNEDILNMYPGMRTPKEFKEVLEQILAM